MRIILVDWMIDVSVRFRLQTETFHLAVNLTDRFIGKRMVRRSEMQLLGVTSLAIAAKYQEIYPPLTDDLVYMTNDACQKEQVLSMEEQILSVLEFEINVPTPNYFVEIFTRAINMADFPIALSSIGFLVDLAILMHVDLNYSPSIIALSAMRLSFFRMSQI